MTTVTITIPDPLDTKLQSRAAAQGRDIVSVALELVEKGLRDDPPPPSASDLTPEQRLQAFQVWLQDRPRVEVKIDDSRESIYEGRGE